MSHRKFVSVVILNYNGKHFLNVCLASLQDMDYPKKDYEIVLVDNASTDGSADFVRKKFPSVNLVQSQKNIGFASGCNLGVENAKGKYVVMLNNDTSVDKDWLTHLYNKIDSDSNIAAVNSKVLLFKTIRGQRLVQNTGVVVFKNGYACDRGAVIKDRSMVYEFDNPYYDQEADLIAFCGASVIIRRDVFDKLGGFDDSYFIYYEDVDLSLRIRRLGYRIVYEPKSLVDHVHSGTMVQSSIKFNYNAEKNRLATLFKHFPFFVFLREFFRYLMMFGVTIFRTTRFKFKMDDEQYNKWKNTLIYRSRVLYWLISHLPYFIYKRYSFNQSEKLSIPQLYEVLS